MGGAGDQGRSENIWVPDRYEEHEIVRRDEYGRKQVVVQQVLVERGRFKRSIAPSSCAKVTGRMCRDRC